MLALPFWLPPPLFPLPLLFSPSFSSDPSIHPADAQTCAPPPLQGFSNNWLRVVPRTRFGAFARGAKVVLYTKKSGAHLRIIDGGSGYLCEMEPVAHFGLGESGLRGSGGSCQGSGMQASAEPTEMQGSQPEHLPGTTSYWREPCFEMNLNSEGRFFMPHFLLGSPSPCL